MNEVKQYNRIFFVDDDLELAKRYKEALKEKELAEHLIHVKNGQEAIAYLKRARESELPDYILLDLYMPTMSGFEFLEKYNNIKSLRNKIEIYVCTSSQNKEDRDEVMNYPFVNAFLEKPLSEEFLEMLIRES
ncbi:MAG: response regulator [Lentimicrobium sp.]|jgi:CheY-like chemotaxis protein|nr:response regulator [Lentimicrobium sp.]